jgi:hypothetical protein
MPTRSGAIIAFAAGLVAGESLLGVLGQLLRSRA